MDKLFKFVVLFLAIFICFIATSYSIRYDDKLYIFPDTYLFIMIFLSAVTLKYRALSLLIAAINIIYGAYICFFILYSPITFIIFLMSSLFYIIYFRMN